MNTKLRTAILLPFAALCASFLFSPEMAYAKKAGVDEKNPSKQSFFRQVELRIIEVVLFYCGNTEPHAAFLREYEKGELISCKPYEQGN